MSFSFPVNIHTFSMSAQNAKIYYPAITGLSNKEVEKSINNMILQKVYMIIHKLGYSDNGEMTGSYEIKTNERGLLSLTLSIFTYHYQTAHGITYLEPITVDLSSGKFYTLQELFKLNSLYIERLSSMIKKQIKNRKILLSRSFQMIKPDQDFYLADKSLVILFQMSEISPSFVGLQAFPISVYDLHDLIDENGPLAIIAANT